MNPKHVSGYYNEHLFVYLSIFALLALAMGIADRQLVGDNLTRDDLFYESGVVYRVDYVQTANVSTGVDERMLAPVPDPCGAPYDMVCARWRKSGSYLVDNARAIHDRRMTRALTHSAVKHPFLSTLYSQCLAHLVDPLSKASALFLRHVVAECEPHGPSSSELEANLGRLACYERRAVFPLLDWRHARVQLSTWADAGAWGDALVADACGVLANMEMGSAEECAAAVHSTLNILKHLSAAPSEQRIMYAEWRAMTHGIIALREANGTTPDTVTLWNREMAVFALSALGQAVTRWFVRAAAVGDMLQYAGHPAYFTTYSTATSLNLGAAERAHPPSVYGWGPAGYAQIMVPRASAESDDHPDMMNVCLDGVGELLPQAIDAMIYPKNATVEAARAVIEAVRAAYIASIQASDALTPSFKATVTALLSEMEVAIGNHRTVDIAAHGATFLESALLARAYNRAQGAAAMPGSFHFDTFNAMYDPARNRMFIPTLLLLSPFFNASDAAELHYGRLGVLAGHEMGHVFDRFALQKAGRVSGEDFRILSNALRCFSNGHASFNEHETLPDVMGFEMALRACQRAGACATPRARMTFFAVYGQTLCENRDNGFGLHNAPADRLAIVSALARNADLSGFAASVWSCARPSTCAFWK